MNGLRKVLVVDDDVLVGKSFSRVLTEDKGYRVITSHNAAEALQKLHEQEVDLVFTSIKMPGMDGLELAGQVKARWPQTSVVIISSDGTTANETRAKAAGVSAFIHKPLSPELIEESAVQALRQSGQPMAATFPAIAPEPVPAQKESRIKNILLFLIAPFVAIAYAVLMPFVIPYMMVQDRAKASGTQASVK